MSSFLLKKTAFKRSNIGISGAPLSGVGSAITPPNDSSEQMQQRFNGLTRFGYLFNKSSSTDVAQTESTRTNPDDSPKAKSSEHVSMNESTPTFQNQVDDKIFQHRIFKYSLDDSGSEDERQKKETVQNAQSSPEGLESVNSASATSSSSKVFASFKPPSEFQKQSTSPISPHFAFLQKQRFKRARERNSIVAESGDADYSNTLGFNRNQDNGKFENQNLNDLASSSTSFRENEDNDKNDDHAPLSKYSLSQKQINMDSHTEDKPLNDEENQTGEFENGSIQNQPCISGMEIPPSNLLESKNSSGESEVDQEKENLENMPPPIPITIQKSDIEPSSIIDHLQLPDPNISRRHERFHSNENASSSFHRRNSDNFIHYSVSSSKDNELVETVNSMVSPMIEDLSKKISISMQKLDDLVQMHFSLKKIAIESRLKLESTSSNVQQTVSRQSDKMMLR